ncbi:hypothetical protein OBBRIDRAFT_835494 [Obba rivulosa]|uniref:Uncharacterized protein n=1 Tax=Obba rivulosa TaxID=1052685 RepID=A0A8E2AT45_9APHY|nr:hypothetical protein OBBRIDRAFT_835494 [Obba rivulosa]
MTARSPFRGSVRKLVIAMDVGTTFSGVGYCILDPGEVPHVTGVRRFPGQEGRAGDSKIPSILYYGEDGTVKAIGAEATLPSVMQTAEDEGWQKVEWFKLRLRPAAMAAQNSDLQFTQMATLPPNKTVIDIFADFYTYLYECTKRYIIETHASGNILWSSLETQSIFILSHPNGWEGAQQAQMRQAAIRAGLVPDSSEGHDRVQFVTEGEASVNFCVGNGLASDVMKDKESIMVVDAGGGTIDISTYSVKMGERLSMEEIAAPECMFEGSAIISFRAREWLQEKLKGSRFCNEQDVMEMFRDFDRSAKLIFRDQQDSSYLKFGSMRDRDPAHGIRNGQITLSGDVVASFFEPSISAIRDAIYRQTTSITRRVSRIFLVGGFAASPWLYMRLKEYGETLNLEVSRPDTHTNKAVAEGAVAFYIDHLVSARVARFTCGVKCNVRFNAEDPEHISRAGKAYVGYDGDKRVPASFDVILKKGTRVSEEQEFSSSFFRTSLELFREVTVNIRCYRGPAETPRWMDTEPYRFETLCIVRADVSDIRMSPRSGPNGSYYRFSYDVVLLFGLTELKAQLRWMDEGKEKRCPATIVFDDDDGLGTLSAP